MHSDLIDSHVHLDDARFDDDRDDVVRRARDAGIIGEVVPAVAAAGWEKLRSLIPRFRGTYPAYGLHPMFLDQHQPEHLDQLDAWLHANRAVAVGECGLDYYLEDLDRDTQHVYFTRQLRIARDHDLPVIIHARRAVEDVILAIRECGGLRGVVHSYAGSAEQARQLADLGFLIGLGGPLTYTRAKRLRRLVTHIPLETLLLETDAPDQPDADHRGQRNEPARVALIAHCVAQLRGEPVEHIAAVTSANTRRLFGIPCGP